MDALPVPATDEMMLQLRRGRPYVSLDTDSVGGYVIRAAAPIEDNSTGPRVLIALYPVPLQLSQLADTVAALPVLLRASGANQAAAQIDLCIDLEFCRVDVLDRGRVRRLLRCAAFGAARAGLIAGTRAVARATTTPGCRCRDAMSLGFLVTSFNDMTNAWKSREETRRSQQAVEAERAGLAVILARLSTGVVLARAGSESAHRQSGGERHSGRRSRSGHRQALR